ncbi:MAG: FeoA family protein [Pseudomonadota bacterium]
MTFDDAADPAALQTEQPEASSSLTPAASAPLSALAPGATARVAGFAANGFEASLREIGFAEGDEVEVMRRGPYGDVIAVRLERALVAVRRAEADGVLVVSG